MEEPLVSVKMVTYNHAPYITQAIEGVLQQKVNFPFELVIGEDCSTDGTREIVFEYQKKYPDIIRVITSEQNVGMTKNSYRTERACRGKYVAYCDGDDYWRCPDKLQKQVDYLENHPDCGLVHSDYDRYYMTSGNIIKKFNQVMNNKPPGNLDICSILRGGRYLYILTCTVMTRREILEEVVDSDPLLYQSDRFLIGDTPRWAEIAFRSKTHYIDESLATYNVLAESASKSKNSQKMLRFGCLARELFLYLVDKHSLPANERKIHEEAWCKCALNLAFCESDSKMAEEVRKRKASFDWSDWLLYWGARHHSMNRFVRLLKALHGWSCGKARMHGNRARKPWT